MAFENEDAKATLIFYLLPSGQYRYSGMVRETYQNGETRLRITTGSLMGVVFDDIEYAPLPSQGEDSELSLTFISEWPEGVV